MKTILYKSGKFYGYELPTKERFAAFSDAPFPFFHEDMFNREVELARANALEIENPGHGIMKKLLNQAGISCQDGTEQDVANAMLFLKSGDTFPLPDTLEWEMAYQCCLTKDKWEVTQKSVYDYWINRDSKLVRQVLRLKEKAVGKDDPGITQFASEEEWCEAVKEAQNMSGIVAIGGIEERGITEDAVIESMFHAQFGGRENCDIITAHMKEYFTRFKSYESKFTNLEWYHIFLDFLDKVDAARSENAQSERHPDWYTKDEIFHWLKRNYSDTISNELAELICEKLKGAYKMGMEKASGQPSPQEESQDSKPLLGEVVYNALMSTGKFLPSEATDVAMTISGNLIAGLSKDYTITRKQPTNH